MNVSARAQSNRLKGLFSTEIEERRKRFGANVLTPPEREPWWRLYLEKFDDPIIRILIIAAVLALGIGLFEGKYLESLGIIIAIFLATTLAFVNEYKASKEFDILNKVNDLVPVKVIRDGSFTTIPRQDIVVGDIVLLEQGEEVPADGKIVEAVSLQIDESRLTGESEPVDKFTSIDPTLEVNKEMVYPSNVVLRGTLVADGHGIIEVSGVGDSTEIGKTARTAAEEEEAPTPLNIQLERLSKWISVVGTGVAALIFAALVGRGAITGELSLTPLQWGCSGVILATLMIALIKIWLPILYVAFELFGWNFTPPKWLDASGFTIWIKIFFFSLLFMVLSFGLGIIFNFISWPLRDLVPTYAIEEFLKFFMISVTIIVVSVPEGLPMSVTLSLAYSMRKMTKSNNLVRRMQACETIGAVTVICSDKTGTLTQNEMEVIETQIPSFYAPHKSHNPKALHKFIIDAVCMNSTAHLGKDSEGNVKVLGNPTEGALLKWLNTNGIDYLEERNNFSIAKQWTFSTERKYMGTMGKRKDDSSLILHIKGAPEIILECCSLIIEKGKSTQLTKKQKTVILEKLLQAQKRGMRTLAFAFKKIHNSSRHKELEQIATKMVWLGFVSIADPVRPEVPPAITACKKAGIDVKIVTGDNHETAQEIARLIGLWNPNDEESKHISGRVFNQLDDEQAKTGALNLKVLSRARPLDKLRLVRVLKEAGHIVAVTGDGTNDAPAMNHANVGLAMGKTGTAVAKEASQIILLDDSFRSIVNGVMWGRSLYENIQRFIVFQLTINVVAMGTALLGPFIGIKLPLTVIQMLWINLIMDTFAALALATEEPHSNVMDRKPRNPLDFILTKSMLVNVLVVGTSFLVFLIGFLLYIQHDDRVTELELSIFFTTFVMLQFWNLFNKRAMGRNESALKGIWANKGFLLIIIVIFIGQVLIVQFGGELFRLVPLSFNQWLYIICGTSIVLWFEEVKRFFNRRAFKIGVQ